MYTSLKLHVDIDCKVYDEDCKDPQTEFFSQLQGIKGVKYSVLPYDADTARAEDELLERGMTNLMTPTYHHETAGTPYDKRPDIIAVFRKYLDRIILSDHLVLVDAYLFSDKDEKGKYSQFVNGIFSEHLKKLQRVTFITKKDSVNKAAKEAITEGFLNVKRQLKIEVKYTDLFHDRFWICGNRAIFVGTSFSGLGKKYCLIDYIDQDDLLTIKGYLKNEKLL